MNASFRLHEDLHINGEIESWFILFGVFVYGKARLHLLSSKLHIFALAGGAGRSELLTGNMMILAGFKSLQAEFLQHTKAWKRSNVAANVKCNQSAVWWVKTCRESVVADHMSPGCCRAPAHEEIISLFRLHDAFTVPSNCTCNFIFLNVQR